VHEGKPLILIFKFQKLHQSKYIKHLEQKVEVLMAENAKLRESLRNSINNNGQQVNYHNNSFNNNSSNKQQLTNSSTNNVPTTPNNYIDVKQVKKIELKKSDNKQSTRQNNKNSMEYVRTDNLNAKTAEIMKASPNTLGGNSKPLMAVSINNSNKIHRDEVSNYEKAVFNKNNNMTTGVKPGQLQQTGRPYGPTSTTTTMNNNMNTTNRV
jgi:hypothetical protein